MARANHNKFVYITMVHSLVAGLVALVPIKCSNGIWYVFHLWTSGDTSIGSLDGTCQQLINSIGCLSGLKLPCLGAEIGL
eukprot:scaffold37745_cov67-Cyclotella_meneghiniana.AAC.3